MATKQGQLSGTSYIGTRIDYYESLVSNENNTSNVHVDAYIISLNGGSGSCKVAKPFYVIVNGETKSITVPAWNISKNEIWKIGSFDFTVLHDDNGSKKITISSSYDTETSLGSSTLNSNLELTKIARQSTISCPDFNIGSATTINIKSANSNYTHTVTYQFGSLSGTIATNTIETSFGWIPNADDFYKQIPNSSSHKGKLFCETYLENIKIGVTTEYQFTASIINSAPILKPLIKDVNEATIALTGDANKIVKYMSNANIIANAKAQNYATINSITVSCFDGKIGTGDNVTLNNVENNLFTIAAIDSRGFSEKINLATHGLISYIPVSIKSFTAARLNPTSSSVKVFVTGDYFYGSFGKASNSLITNYKYRELNGTWSDEITIGKTILSTENSYLIDVTLSSKFDYSKQWEIMLIVSDKLTTVEHSLIISKGIPTTQKSEHKFQVNGTIYQADLDGKNKQKVILDNDERLENTEWQDLSLLNGWTTFSNEYNIPQFKKISDMVQIRGMLQGSRATTQKIAILPEGFRPKKYLYFVYSTSDNPASGRISPDGSIDLYGYKISWNSIDGISFSTK